MTEKNNKSPVKRLLFTSYGLLSELFFIKRKLIKSFFVTKPPKKWSSGKKGDVVLIPGVFETWIFMESIANELNKKGYRIHTLDKLKRNTIPAKKALLILKMTIQAKKLKKVILISHSKGGVVSKMALDDKDLFENIKHSFTIATPYNGSVLALVSIFSLHELIPNSKILQPMERSMQNNTKITNIYPRLDTQVFPNKNLLLKKATNIQTKTVGHSKIQEEKETIDIIISKFTAYK